MNTFSLRECVALVDAVVFRLGGNQNVDYLTVVCLSAISTELAACMDPISYRDALEGYSQAVAVKNRQLTLDQALQQGMQLRCRDSDREAYVAYVRCHLSLIGSETASEAIALERLVMNALPKEHAMRNPQAK